MELAADLLSVSLIGFGEGSQTTSFTASNPATGSSLEPAFYAASKEDVDRAAALAEKAFPVYSTLSGKKKGAFLRKIAEAIEANAPAIIKRANLETALPEPRLNGEMARTCNQLRMFAQLIEEGSWLDARIDTADPDRKPLPKVDIRSMHRALGPVAVFGASNFPLAFSVAGGDTASAFAAGNPVIVKAHPAHPGTSALVGQAVREAVKACGLPEGTFSLVFDAGVEIGVALVIHPAIKAVGFTGSIAGGKALMKLAAERPEPIPVYAEMGSVNPVFVLPEAMRKRGTAIATGLQASFTASGGQMCTKPGLVLVSEDSSNQTFFQELSEKVTGTATQTLLTKAIANRYAHAVNERKAAGARATMLAQGAAPADDQAAIVQAALFVTDYPALEADANLSEEIFGPTTVIVRYADRAQVLAAAEKLEGHLTASVHAEESELAQWADLFEILSRKAGRLILNGYPTGVEVCHSMVHGGPFPATSDGRSTSVGSQAIYRFTRLICYQSFPDAILPDELKAANPLSIQRLLNGERTTKPSA